MGKSVEDISYTCVLFSYSQLLPETLESGTITGSLLPLFFQKGKQRWRRQIFTTVSWGISWLTSSTWNTFSCSYLRNHNIQNGFLHFLLLLLRSTFLLNRNKHIGEEFFVFHKFAFPSALLLTPALPLLRLLPVFYLIPPINCKHLHRLIVGLSNFRSQNR